MSALPQSSGRVGIRSRRGYALERALRLRCSVVPRLSYDQVFLSVLSFHTISESWCLMWVSQPRGACPTLLETFPCGDWTLACSRWRWSSWWWVSRGPLSPELSWVCGRLNVTFVPSRTLWCWHLTLRRPSCPSSFLMLRLTKL